MPAISSRLATDVVSSSVRSFRLDRERAALVIVDMQYASASRSSGLGRWLARVQNHQGSYRFDRLETVVVPSLRRLLAAFREYDAPVVHVQVGSSVADCGDLTPAFRHVEHLIGNYIGTHEFQILEELAPAPGESVVTKLSASAFTSSSLDALLRNLGVAQLIVGGVSTSHCVDLTARDAADRGYEVVVVDDGCAEDTPELHSMSLQLFEKLFGRVSTVDKVIRELESSPPKRRRLGRPRSRPAAETLSRAASARTRVASVWAETTMCQPGPLSGLRVIDAGTMIAGPFAATLLGDCGADVIKIEKPRVGDSMRNWAPIKNDLSLWWKVSARNKRLITLDLGMPTGRTLFLELAAQADVIIENFRPGTFERWGLGYDVLRARNPGVIFVRVSGYGQTGPYRDRPGYGTVADAMSGIPAFTGAPEGAPTLPAFPLADSLAGCFAVIGALSALRDKQRSQKGDEIDVSLYEPLFRIAESQVIAFDQLGLKKQRVGNRLEEDAPRNTYATSDGEWIALSASSDRTFQRLAEAVERPELCTDPRFASNQARIHNVDELDAIISAWVMSRTADVVLSTFEEHDVIAGRIYDIEDIFRDPHYAARGDIAEVPDADFGTLRMPGIVPRFSRHACTLRHAGGALGQDNESVLGQILGLSTPQLRKLETEGVI